MYEVEKEISEANCVELFHKALAARDIRKVKLILDGYSHMFIKDLLGKSLKSLMQSLIQITQQPHNEVKPTSPSKTSATTSKTHHDQDDDENNSIRLVYLLLSHGADRCELPYYMLCRIFRGCSENPLWISCLGVLCRDSASENLKAQLVLVLSKYRFQKPGAFQFPCVLENILVGGFAVDR